jgi:hypothetical protein
MWKNDSVWYVKISENLGFKKKNAGNNQPDWGYNGMCNHQYDHMRLSENGACQKKTL